MVPSYNAHWLPMAIQLERLRQLKEEGWTAEHDDQHSNGELFRASSCYAARWRYGHDPESGPGMPMERRPATMKLPEPLVRQEGDPPPTAPVMSYEVPRAWPWDPEWWKPKSALRDLARAGALLMADIDRRARAGEPWAAVEERLREVVAWGRLRGCWL